MNLKFHYLVTFFALVLWGVIFANQAPQTPLKNGERICEIKKGRTDCFYRSSDNRINKNSEVQYKFN